MTARSAHVALYLSENRFSNGPSIPKGFGAERIIVLFRIRFRNLSGPALEAVRKLNPVNMFRIRTVTIVLFTMLILSCQREELDLPVGKAPFLQVKSERVDSLLAAMTLEEKIGQLIYARVQNPGEEQLEQVLDGVASQRIGGLDLRGLTLDGFLMWRDSLRAQSRQELFLGSQEAMLVNGQFSDIESLPSAWSMQALRDDTLRAKIEALHFDQLNMLNLNWAVVSAPYLTDQTSSFLQTFSDRHILGVAAWDGFEEMLSQPQPRPEQWIAYRRQAAGGLSGVQLPWRPAIEDSMAYRRDFLAWKLERQTGFDGLIAGEWTPEVDPVRFLQAGADQLIVENGWEDVFRQLRSAVDQQSLTQEELDHKVRRILLAKEWTGQVKPAIQPVAEGPTVVKASFSASLRLGSNNPGGGVPVSVSNVLREHFNDPDWVVLKHALYHQSMVLLSNPGELAPFDLFRPTDFRITQYSPSSFFHFKKQFEKYADYKSHLVKPEEGKPLAPFEPATGKQWVNIVLLDQPVFRERDGRFIKSMSEAAKKDPLVLINFGPAKNIAAFDSTFTIIQIYERNELTEEMAAQLLFGALGAQGRLPETINTVFTNGRGLKTYPTRLAYGIPQEVGIAPEKLVGIDAIMRSAIDEQVIPGGQILVAKAGKVIYSKAFGYHTFNRKEQEKVDEHDLYDVASITKVAATTLAAMQLYDLNEFKLNDRLGAHLDLVPEATIKNIPIKKLLIHQSGLQANMPIAPYVYAKEGLDIDCHHFFCDERRDTFSVPIADHMYFNRLYRDSLWYAMQTLRLRPQYGFRYSDVNFNLIQRLVETKANKPLDEWVSRHFYQPMGLRFSTFNPRQKFDAGQIVPTQDDQRWRKQLLRGYVHDESAALLGGVGGSAGLFTTAEDLAVIFQMLLNRGVYGGRRYLSAATVDLFTSAVHGNHRGLGFDKPGGRTKNPTYAEEASAATFGHNGFTGTCVWADPEHELIYIFLSNRVYPDGRNQAFFRSNIRQRIHKVIYDALGTFNPELPHLPATKDLMAREG